MKRLLSLALMVLLAGCWRFSTDVSFSTDPRVLRGTWTGSQEVTCQIPITSRVFNPTATQFFAIQDKQLEVFDSTTNSKLGGFTLPTTQSPVVWSADGSSLIYLRSTNPGLERATVNPLTGADVTVTALTGDFVGTSFSFNTDLTRIAVFATSGITGISRIDLYDLQTSALIKSKNVTGINPNSLLLSPDGTKILYTISNTKTVLLLHNFTDDTTRQAFERANGFQVLGFNGNNQISINYVDYAANSSNPNVTKRINLTDLTTRDSFLPQTISALKLSDDGIRVAYIQNDTLYIKNLDTNIIIAQKTLNTPPQMYGSNNFPATIYGATPTGTKWFVSASRSGCAFRTFDADQQILSPNISIGPDDSKTIIMTFTPTYRDSSSYTFTGTIKIGTATTRNLRGSVRVPNDCVLFSNSGCEKLSPSTPATIPPPYELNQVHWINLQYENGEAFDYPIVVVGYRYDQKKVQLFAGDYSYSSQNKKFFLDPTITP